MPNVPLFPSLDRIADEVSSPSSGTGGGGVAIPRNRTSLVSYSPLKEEEEEGTDKLARGQSEDDDDDPVALRISENRQVRSGAEGERKEASTYMMSIHI